MAHDRDLGLAAGRRGDRMTVFTLIRDKLLGQMRCPRSPLSPAVSVCAVMVLGITNTVQVHGARAGAQAQSGSISGFSTCSLTTETMVLWAK